MAKEDIKYDNGHSLGFSHCYCMKDYAKIKNDILKGLAPVLAKSGDLCFNYQ